jgi:hypothetical protein
MPSIKQRICLMRAHKSICRYCNLPIDNLAVLEIDHVIPESLTPEELMPLLARLGKPELEVNSYFNWFPVHNMCNRHKSDDILPDEALHALLARAAKKVPDALEEEVKFDRQLKVRDALANVVRQIELGTTTKEAAIAVIEGAQTSTTSNADPIILSFSLDLAKAKRPAEEFRSPGELLLASDADDDTLIDTELIAELEAALNSSNVLTVTSEAPQNTGETLSVRFAVWLLDLENIPHPLPNGWQLMEVGPFSEIYRGQDPEVLSNEAIIRKRNELILDKTSEDPLPYRYCPMCGKQNLKRHSMARPDTTVYYINCHSCGWGERSEI